MKNLILLLSFSCFSFIGFGQNTDKLKHEEIQLDESTMEKYVGEYLFAYPGIHANIFIDENKMFAQITGEKRWHIIPFEENKFSMVDLGLLFTFNFDKDGKVKSMIYEYDGNQTHLKKKGENQLDQQLDQVELFKQYFLGKWGCDDC
ncbi:MAG: DUF3471 domain-containing protein [Cyclobacteriaceae bacterium]|nr:DUF3471 domain-containing protein [Cyclobacteriaceae bacterium]